MVLSLVGEISRWAFTRILLIDIYWYHTLQVGRPNNVPQAAPIIARIQEEALKYPRIYVASIHPDLTESDVRR